MHADSNRQCSPGISVRIGRIGQDGIVDSRLQSIQAHGLTNEDMSWLFSSYVNFLLLPIVSECGDAYT